MNDIDWINRLRDQPFEQGMIHNIYIYTFLCVLKVLELRALYIVHACVRPIYLGTLCSVHRLRTSAMVPPPLCIRLHVFGIRLSNLQCFGVSNALVVAIFVSRLLLLLLLFFPSQKAHIFAFWTSFRGLFYVLESNNMWNLTRFFVVRFLACNVRYGPLWSEGSLYQVTEFLLYVRKAWQHFLWLSRLRGVLNNHPSV